MKKFYPSKIGKYDPDISDDLYDCLNFNEPKKIIPDDIEGMMAEVCGENDAYDWWWILKLKNGKYLLLSAGCDYTGWDCRSSINHESIYSTLDGAVKASPEKEEFTDRHIRQSLQDQIENREVIGIYREEK